MGRTQRVRPGGALIVVLAVALVGCGRSGNDAVPSTPPKSASGAPSAAPSAAAAGTFGDLGRICGPAKPGAAAASGPAHLGLTDGAIRLGTIGDPGASATPGLEQEYFDVGKAFSKWCNAAGGINGRKIILDTYDAKLFEGAAQIINACSKDFMLVGNGNAFDAVDVKPRLACKLAQLPALSVSPEAGLAGLQVQATSNAPTYYSVGPMNALVAAYPAAKNGIGIGSSNVASLRPQGQFAKQVYEAQGYRVSALQEKSAFVVNFRPYMEQLRNTGTHGYQEIASQDPTPQINAMHDIGWQPDFALWGIQFYDPKSVAAAKVVKFPPSYVALGALPAELADDPRFPVLREIRSIMTAGVENPKFTSFTGLAISAWTLWAKSATECGANLTTQCILSKAGAYTDWTAGGFFPPHSTVPGKQTLSDCFLFVRLTPNGFVYDKKLTNPNSSVYNCNPKNLAKIKQ